MQKLTNKDIMPPSTLQLVINTGKTEIWQDKVRLDPKTNEFSNLPYGNTANLKALIDPRLKNPKE